MPDFAVDYGVLQQVQRALSHLKGELTDIGAVQGAADWGYGDVDAQMGSFAGNWSHHRQKLLASMDAMIKNVQETVTGTQEYDTKNAQQLTKG